MIIKKTMLVEEVAGYFELLSWRCFDWLRKATETSGWNLRSLGRDLNLGHSE